MHKQRYAQKKKVNNTTRVRMIMTYGDYIVGREYRVDSTLADFLVESSGYAVRV